MTKTPRKIETASPTARSHSYARLYQAVILRAVQDLSQQEHQDEAREWLLSSESDFAFATAGISPDSLRPQVL